MLKTQTRLLLLLLAVIGCFLLGLAALNKSEANRNDLILADLESGKTTLLNEVVGLKGDFLATFAYDYSYWDDMVRFVGSADKQWAAENIDPSLSTYQATAAWVCRPDFSVVYSVDDTPGDGVLPPAISAEQAASIRKNHGFSRFFVHSGQGLMEVRCAPIQPSADLKRETPPQGFFLVARLWDQEFVTNLENYAGGRVHLALPSPDSGAWVSSRQDAAVRFSRPLTAWDGSVVALLRGEVRSDFLSELNSAVYRRSWIAVGFATVLLLFLSLALHFWVTRPLRLISNALASDSPTPIAAMKRNRSEFGHLAHLVSRFFQQKADLLEEIGGRMRTEEALRTSEERFRRYFELGLIGMCISSPEGKWLEVNDRLCDILGYSRAELTNLSWADVTHFDDMARCQEPFRKLLGGEIDSYTLDKRYIRKDGEVIYASISASCVRKLDGSVDYVVALVEDVTERKGIDKGLQESRELLKATVESTADGILVVNNEGKVIHANARFGEMWRIPQAVLASYDDDTLLAFVLEQLADPQAFLSRVRELYQSVQEDFDSLHFRDGRVFERFSCPLMGEGKVVGRVWSFRNVTERACAEEALRQSEERYRYLYNNTPVMLHSIDRNGVLVSVSDFWLAALGYEREEVIGRRSTEFLTESSRRLALEVVLPEYMETGICRDIEYQFVKKNGEVIDTLLSAIAERDSEGQVERSLAVVIDITERKRAAEEHERALAKLEKAQRMEALAVLAGGVAHDLNNILGPLVAYPELILDRLPGDSPVRKNIEAMGRAATQAVAIIRDLLTLARRGRYEMATTDLNEVVTSYVSSPNFVELMLRNPKVVHRLELDPNLRPILGSAMHLSTMLMNLVVNAVDAMPTGGELVIRSHQSFCTRLACGYDRVVPGDYLVITVSDTGVGIAEEDLTKIFEPYFSKKKMSRSSGSGLGLSIVYGIVKDHKGYYDVQSVLGKGTSFSLLFPVPTEDAGSCDKQSESLGGSESILVVDDDAEQRQLAEDLLENLGYQVTTAADGCEAARYVSERSFDLVVMDMIMGGLDGLDTYCWMLGINPRQKVIVVSGYSATERVEEMQRLGAGAYLRKPFTREELGRAVRSELNRDSFVEAPRKLPVAASGGSAVSPA